MRHPSEPGWPPEDPPALDGDSAERLASGRTAPDDAPPGYEGVASLLHSVASAAGPGLHGPNAVTVPKGEAETVAAMAAVLAPTTPTSLSSRRRQSMITKLVPAKVAAVAMGALLSTGAAAAAGALPDPVQAAVSDALGAVGLQVPDGSNSGSDPLDVLDETTTTTLDDTTTTTLDDTTTTTLDDTTTTTLDDGTTTTTPDACTSAANHGQFVSGVARATPPGPGHGAVVSDAARSDCGRNGGDDGGEVDDGDTTDTTIGSNTAGSNSGPGNSGKGNSGKGNSGNGNSGSGGRSGRG